MQARHVVVAALAATTLLGTTGCAAPDRPSSAASATAPATTPAQPANPTPPAEPLPATSPAAPATQAPQQLSWAMPDLIGSNLQDAQNAIQALTEFAIAITTSTDATGQHRMQVLDANWQVCTQNVPPGATITASTAIDFGAVKLDERCP